ncbi:MAG: hypothetical protein IJT25_02345 [Clostridia bacterium]|nr:hypothetical protein [Clostridia bacterium]
MKNSKLGFLSGLLGIVMLVLIAGLGTNFMFKYTGTTSGNIGLFNYVQDSGKTTAILDSETASLEFSGNNDAYASHLLISNERINRTEESKTYSIIILICSMILLVVLLFSLACEILSMFSYYKKRVQVLTMILRVLILAISIVLTISAPLYLQSLASGLEVYFKIGFSVFVLPILALINLILFFVFIPQKRNKEN